MKQTLEAILKDHPFVKDLNPKHLHLLIGCAANIRIEQGKYLFKENQPAENFSLFAKVKLQSNLLSQAKDKLQFKQSTMEIF